MWGPPPGPPAGGNGTPYTFTVAPVPGSPEYYQSQQFAVAPVAYVQAPVTYAPPAIGISDPYSLTGGYGITMAPVQYMTQPQPGTYAPGTYPPSYPPSDQYFQSSPAYMMTPTPSYNPAPVGFAQPSYNPAPQTQQAPGMYATTPAPQNPYGNNANPYPYQASVSTSFHQPATYATTPQPLTTVPPASSYPGPATPQSYPPSSTPMTPTPQPSTLLSQSAALSMPQAPSSQPSLLPSTTAPSSANPPQSQYNPTSKMPSYQAPSTQSLAPASSSAQAPLVVPTPYLQASSLSQQPQKSSPALLNVPGQAPSTPLASSFTSPTGPSSFSGSSLQPSSQPVSSSLFPPVPSAKPGGDSHSPAHQHHLVHAASIQMAPNPNNRLLPDAPTTQPASGPSSHPLSQTVPPRPKASVYEDLEANKRKTIAQPALQVSAPAPAAPKGPPKDSVSAVSLLVELTKNLTLDANEIKSLIDDQAQWNLVVKRGTPQHDQIVKAIESLRKETLKTNALQKYFKADAQSIQAKLLRSAAKGVVSASQALSDSFDSQFYSEPEVAKAAIVQHNIALSFSIKNLVRACEGLTISSYELWIPQDWALKVIEQQKKDAEHKQKLEEDRQHEQQTQTQKWNRIVKRPEVDTTKINLLSYNRDIVTRFQIKIRSILRRLKWRRLVEMLKTDKAKWIHGGRQRAKLLKEIEETEKTYLHSLSILISHFMQPLEKKLDKFFTAGWRDFVKNFFGEVELQIYTTAFEFFNKLHARRALFPSNSCIGDIFLEMVPRMKCYTTFVVQYDQFIRLLDQAKKDHPAIIQFLKDCMDGSGARLDFESYLIQPIQRLPRYQLLLREVIKFTEAEHVDLPNLEAAASKITEVNTEINSTKRVKDNEEKLRDLSFGVSGIPFDLSKADRIFVKEGDAIQVKKSEKKTVTLLVFNDLIMIVKRKKKGSYDFEQYFALGGHSEFSATSQGFDIYQRDSKQSYNFQLLDPIEHIEAIKVNEIKQVFDTLAVNQLIQDTLHISAPEFQIVFGSYGKMHDSSKSVDVTAKLREICASQGGKGLALRSDSKTKLFGCNPGGLMHSNHLTIVYSLNGNVVSVTFADHEAVHLPN